MKSQIFIGALTPLFGTTHLAFLLLGTALGLLISVLPGLGAVARLSFTTWFRRKRWR